MVSAMITSDQQGLEDERRMIEEEAARYDAAHPHHAFCPKHPERPVVNRSVCTLCWCAECLEAFKNAAADYRPSEYGLPDTLIVGGEYYTRGRSGTYGTTKQDKGQDETK